MTTNEEIVQAAFIYLNESPSALLLQLDTEQRVVSLNAQACKCLRQDAMGKRFKDLVANFTSIPEHLSDKAMLLTLNPAHGGPESFYFKFFPLSNGTLVIGSLDISEQQRLRTEVLELNRDLNDLTRQVYQAKAELEQRVQERTAEILDLYNNAPCGYHSLAADGLILRMNDTELRWLGYQQEEVINRLRMIDLMTPEDAATFSSRYPVFVQKEDCLKMEAVLLRKNRSPMAVDMEFLAVRDAKNHFDKARVAVLDATQRKRAEEALRRSERIHRIVADNTYDWEFWQDMQGVFVYCSPSCLRITGHKAEEFLADSALLERIIHPDDKAAYGEHHNNIISGKQTSECEFRVIRPDQTECWIGQAVQLVFDEEGERSGWRGSNRDITGRKKAEEELIRAKVAAESANKAKSVFLANMSHELRTPMNAILGFAQLLSRDSQLSTLHQEHLTTIIRSGKHLMNIINEILEMARIESGRVTLNVAAFDLQKMLDELELMFNERTEAKNICFRLDRQGNIPRYVMTDETKLRQVIINLLGNALKFTKEGGQIIFRVRTVGESNNTFRLNIQVQDTGTGIDPEDIKRLFKPFFQTDAGKQISGGTGLGLAISNEFVRLMHGKIIVSSQLGAGSTFEFEIELEQADDSSIPKQIPPSRQVLHLKAGQVCRILVVDDNTLNRELLMRILMPVGFDIRMAVNGSEAVAMAQEWSPHLILMDLRMPVMDGYEATMQIKKRHHSSIKIIALSASVFKDDQIKAIDTGADTFVFKPFERNQLLECIKELTHIDYAYEEYEENEVADPLPHSKACSSLPGPEQIEQLPSELIDALLDATNRADYEKMLDLVSHIELQDKTLGSRLRQLVENLEYVVLQRILSNNK